MVFCGWTLPVAGPLLTVHFDLMALVRHSHHLTQRHRTMAHRLINSINALNDDAVVLRLTFQAVDHLGLLFCKYNDRKLYFMCVWLSIGSFFFLTEIFVTFCLLLLLNLHKHRLNFVQTP